MNYFFRWWFRGKIAYLQRMRLAAMIDDADIRRDGKSKDYWFGKAIGIEVALKILDLEDLGKSDS